MVIRLRGQLKKCRVKNVFTLSLGKVCTKIIFENKAFSIIGKNIDVTISNLSCYFSIKIFVLVNECWKTNYFVSISFLYKLLNVKLGILFLFFLFKDKKIHQTLMAKIASFIKQTTFLLLSIMALLTIFTITADKSIFFHSLALLHEATSTNVY